MRESATGAAAGKQRDGCRNHRLNFPTSMTRSFRCGWLGSWATRSAPILSSTT